MRGLNLLLLTALILVIFPIDGKAQLDSLLKVHSLRANKKFSVVDTLKFNRLHDQTREIMYTNTELCDSTMNFIVKYAEGLPHSENKYRLKHKALITLANCKILSGNYEEALKTFGIVEKSPNANDPEKIKAKANMGIVYYYKNQYALALEHYLSSMELAKKKNLPYANQLVNICLVYQILNNIDKQLFYAKEAINYAIKHQDSITLAYSYNSLGVAYKSRNDIDSARISYEKAYEIAFQVDDPVVLADASENLGLIYNRLKNHDKSDLYFGKALTYSRKLNRNAFSIHVDWGDCYIGRGKLKEAKIHLDKARSKLDEEVSLTGKKEFYKFQANYYKATGQIELAYISLEKSHILDDSLKRNEVAQNVNQLEQDYALRESRLEDSLKFAIEKQNISEKTKLITERKNAQLKFQKGVIWFSVAFGLLLLIGLFYVFRMYASKRKDSEVIAFQRDLVEAQKENIELKNKELTDSINYAKNLQDALIPTEQQLSAIFDDIGLVYLPKDIVSGDFYWTYQTDSEIFLAVADCTGHGVPGAMMSLVGINSLERCVREFNLCEPADILNQLNVLVESTFSRHDYNINDGMDISLCKIEKQTKVLSYAGAYNPLWIFSREAISSIPETDAGDRGVYIYTLQADKQPIGKFDHRKPFTNTLIKLPDSAKICMFTDGFADQFGGPLGKKYKYAQLRNSIANNYSQNAGELSASLKKDFETWIGDLEQIDDVTLLILSV